MIRARAALLASFYGADWFRFDFFYGHPTRGFRVNEARTPRAPPCSESARRLLAARASDRSHRARRRRPQVSYPSHHVYTSAIREAWAAAYDGDAMLEVDGGCVADYMLDFIGVERAGFDHDCYLCRPSPPAPPPAPPAPPSPPGPPPSPYDEKTVFSGDKWGDDY